MSPTGSRKTKRTFYTDARVAAARENIAKYAWASEIADHAYRNAAPYLAMSYSELFGLVTPQSVPRACRLHESAGCPVCGDDVQHLGMFPYELDPDGIGWTIRCPLCKSVFPSNDFSAYYQSGFDDRGLFDRNLADPALLKNTRYPDKPDDWMVDDGYGAIDTLSRDRINVAGRRATGTRADAHGIRYMCVGYYNHWAVWGFPMVNLETYGRVFAALLSLRDAYLYSGRHDYANALATLLYRVATVYPDMSIDAYPWDAGFCNSCGNTGMGKIVGRIWECRVARDFVLCYDAVFDAIATGNCGPALAFLESRNENNDIKGVIAYIENALVRNMFFYIESGQIKGNKGMHESTLGTAAVVLDDMETAIEWLEWLYKPGDEDPGRTPRITGGNLKNVLVDRVDRDGMGDEASPCYNAIWMRDYKVLADALDGWDGPAEYRLYEHPVYRKMFMPYEKLIMLETYLPTIADSGSCGDPGFGRRGAIEEFFAVDAFYRYGTVELAQFAELLHRKAGKPLHPDIFTGGQDELMQRLDDVIRSHGPFRSRSVNMTGYGFAAIRNRLAWDAWMYYGRTFGHGHADALTIGLHAFGFDLSPDLGNPEHKNRFNRMTHEWFKNTINHNTVVVDETRQRSVYGGLPRAYYDGTIFGLVDVESPGAYPQTRVYRRGIVAVHVGETDMYLVDFFRVQGGNSHVFSFHGAEGDAQIADITLIPEAGTYAGPDVPYGRSCDSGDRPPHEYEGSGFHFLDNVERAEAPVSPVVVVWNIRDTWGMFPERRDVKLRLIMLAEVDDIAFADGRPAQNYIGNPEKLRYFLARRRGENLESHFVSVVEPFRGRPVIVSTSRVDLEWVDNGDPIDRTSCIAAGIRVDPADGTTDLLFTSMDPAREIEARISEDHTIRFAGMYVFLRTRKGWVEHAVLYGGTKLEYDGNRIFDAPFAFIEGVVTDFTRALSAQNEIVVRFVDGCEPPLDEPFQMTVENVWERDVRSGRIPWRIPDGIRHDHAYADIRNGTFNVLSAEATGEGLYRLDIGDATLIEYCVDTRNHEAGYVYTIAAGDRVRIPGILEYDAGRSG